MNIPTEKFLAARLFAACIAAILVCAAVASAGGQKNKKNSKDATPPADQSAQQAPIGTDNDQIENAIGEMLGAFQIGDVETMHKHYSENVTFVSGDYAPPVMGWQNYAALYARQRPAFQGMQIVRRNTLIYAQGDFAWATYQWEFVSSVNGQPYSLRGHTTLIFNKVGGNWLIVHNHTSGVYPEGTATAQQAPAGIAAPRP